MKKAIVWSLGLAMLFLNVAAYAQGATFTQKQVEGKWSPDNGKTILVFTGSKFTHSWKDSMSGNPRTFEGTYKIEGGKALDLTRADGKPYSRYYITSAAPDKLLLREGTMTTEYKKVQ